VIERLDAVEGALAAPVEDTVTPRVEELERRLQAESAAAADRARSAQKEARQSLADVAARLTAVEEDLATPDGSDVAPRLEELERRLEREASQADERTRATELALRDGLGSLAARLADSEAAYVEAGEGLRRSIERLGRAIVETDDRIAARHEPARTVTTDGYVAFAPTSEGYRLVTVAGPAPEIGLTVELDGYEEPLRVTRIGASPIPLDERPCAYLDRA
jgi:hypothetical protein